MDEPKPLGGMGYQEALDSAGQKISKISSDVEKMAKWAESFAKSMKEAADASKAIAASSKATRKGGPSKGAGNTGSAPDQGIGTAEVSETQEPGMGWRIAGGTFKLGIAAVNDLRIGATSALQYEQARYLGRTGGVDYDKFRGMVSRATNDYNVQNRVVFAQDVGFAFNQGYGELFGGGNLGQQKAAESMGGMHTLARNAGLAPEAARGAMTSLYGSETYYNALAAGIFTRNPVTGDAYTPEQIVDQYMQGRLRGKSAEEIRRWTANGGMGMAELLQVTGGDTGLAEMIRQGMILSAESGGASLAEGSIAESMEATNRAGGVGTQGMDSMSRLQGAEMSRVGDYTDDITNGIRTANDLMTDINESLTDLEGPLRDLVAAVETSGSFMDTLNNVLPRTIGQFSDIISSAMTLLAAKMMFGGKGGDGTGGLFGGKGGKGLLKGAARMAGRVAPPAAALTAGVAATEWAGNNLSGDTWDTTDTLGTVAAYAGTGALVGSIIPGVGTAIGATVGTVVGGLVGIGRSVSRENAERDYDSAPSSRNAPAKGGRPKYSEGEWFVEANKSADIHYGEMILPGRVAQAVRDELSKGKTPSSAQRGGSVVNITVNVQRASDAEAVRLARMVKRHINRDDELMAIGDGRLVGPIR